MCRNLLNGISVPDHLDPSFFCRLDDDVVYWNTSRCPDRHSGAPSVPSARLRGSRQDELSFRIVLISPIAKSGTLVSKGRCPTGTQIVSPAHAPIRDGSELHGQAENGSNDRLDFEMALSLPLTVAPDSIPPRLQVP